MLHLDTPSSASWVTPASISLFSGEDTSLTAQGDAHLTAAHTDAQQIWSDKDLTVQSTTDEIRIQASSSTLTAGQSQIEIKGGNITFTCPGTWTVKGTSHAWESGGGRGGELPSASNRAVVAIPPALPLS